MDKTSRSLSNALVSLFKVHDAYAVRNDAEQLSHEGIKYGVYERDGKFKAWAGSDAYSNVYGSREAAEKAGLKEARRIAGERHGEGRADATGDSFREGQKVRINNGTPDVYTIQRVVGNMLHLTSSSGSMKEAHASKVVAA